MTEQELYKKWTVRLTSFGLFGMHKDCTGGTLARASHAMDVVPESQALVREFMADCKAVYAPVPVQQPAVQQPVKPPQPTQIKK